MMQFGLEKKDPDVVHDRSAGFRRLTFWAFADQGTVSVGNFASQLVLARFLAPREYGVFAVLYGFLLLLNVCHLCLVTYPLSLLGASANPSRLRSISAAALCLTLVLNLVLLVPVGLATMILHQQNTTVWVMLALLLWQLQETIRRALMAHRRFLDTMWGDFFSYVVQALALGVLLSTGHRSLERVFQIMAVTSALGGLLQYWQLGNGRLNLSEVTELLRVGRREGRWAFLTSFSNVITSAALPWILILRGATEAAAYQAVVNLMSFTNPVATSTGNLILPVTANVGEEISLRLKRARQIALHGGILLLPLFAFVLVAPGFAMRMLYGEGSAYAGLYFPAQIAALAFAMAYLGHVQMSVMYGLARGRAAFRGQLFGTAGLLLAAPLAVMLGVTGAVLGLFCVNLLRVIGNVLQFSSATDFAAGSVKSRVYCEEK